MVFTTQAIGPAAMALRTDIRDSWIANICSDIYICNNIRDFVQYKEIKPL